MFGSGASPQLAEGKFHSSAGRISLPKGNFTLAKQEFHFEGKDLDKLRFDFDKLILNILNFPIIFRAVLHILMLQHDAARR